MDEKMNNNLDSIKNLSMNGLEEENIVKDTNEKKIVATEKMILEYTGENSIENILELIIRGMGISSIDETIMLKLSSLELLSISHNRFHSINLFSCLLNLVELNINFNFIDSLAPLKCTGLKKLYASNNKITEISSLRDFLSLQVVSLYGNLLSNLENSLQICRGLTKLKYLDIGANPCTTSVHGYKYIVLKGLPRLEELDGEMITPFDKEMVEEFYLKSHGTDAKGKLFPERRPCSSNGKLNEIPMHTTFSAPAAPNTSLISSNRMFRDDALNNNPILLEYLAQAAIENQTLNIPPELDTNASNFVTKLRQASDIWQDQENDVKTSNNIPMDKGNQDNTNRNEIKGNKEKTTKAHFAFDPSDPYATIRRLIQQNEMLSRQQDLIVSLDGISGFTNKDLEAIIKENNRLQIENNNMMILQEEIKSLKEKHRQHRTYTDDNNLIKKIQDLESELSASKDEIERLKKENTALKETSNCDEADSNINNTKEELEEFASFEPELAELMIRNEVSLRQIRHDIVKTKKEMELDTSLQNMKMYNNVRPSTSAGYGHFSLNNYKAEVKPTNFFSSINNNSQLNRRNIKTSAGYPQQHRENNNNINVPSNLIKRELRTTEDINEVKSEIENAIVKMDKLKQVKNILDIKYDKTKIKYNDKMVTFQENSCDTENRIENELSNKVDTDTQKEEKYDIFVVNKD